MAYKGDVKTRWKGAKIGEENIRNIRGYGANECYRTLNYEKGKRGSGGSGWRWRVGFGERPSGLLML